MNSQIINDPVTLVLLALLFLLVVVPGGLLVARRVTQLPFRVESFRWIYVIWGCLLAASSVWNLSRDVRLSVDEAGADNYLRLGFLMLAILGIGFVGMKHRYVFIPYLATGAIGAFFLFSVWGLSTTLWSVSPPSTLYKSVEYGAMLVLFGLAVSLILRNTSSHQHSLLALKSIFDWNWFLTFLLIVSVYVGMVVWPEYAILQNYRDQVGVIGFSIQGALPGQSANLVAEIGAILAIVALVRLLYLPKPGVFSTLMYVFVLSLSLVTMVLTQSRSPVLAFLIAFIIVLVVGRRFGWLALSLVVAGATLLLTNYGQVAYEFLRRGQNEKDIASLTGRVTYWKSSLDTLSDSVLGGYGANAGGRYVLRAVLGEEEVSTVHSVWVEVLLDTGVIGFILFAVAVAATWFWLLKLRSRAITTPIGRLLWFECLGVLTIMSVRSVFEVALVWSSRVLTLGVILIFLEVLRRQVVRRTYSGVAGAQLLPAARRRRPSVRS